MEELLAERDVSVDHVTVYRWVQRFTLEFIEAARPCRHAPDDRWFVDETCAKVAGWWVYLYRRFFTPALRAGIVPAEVTADRAPAYPRVLDELVPSALQHGRAARE